MTIGQSAAQGKHAFRGRYLASASIISLMPIGRAWRHLRSKDLPEKKKTPVKKLVHGDDLLYRFFLNLSDAEPDRFTAIAQSFVESMGIWLPVEVYQRSPVLRPWVVRDPDCHGNPSKGIKYRWGHPNKHGYAQDDNSLIKDLPRSQDLRGPRDSHLHGKRMGTEFVASHIWRETSEGLSNRIPLLNSFVPNLVWLPSQISKLSDREDGIVQQTLKAMSRQIYRHVELENHLQPVAEEAWSKLDPARLELPVEFDVKRINWFAVTDRFHANRKIELARIVDALNKIAGGGQLDEKLSPSSYRKGLPDVSRAERSRLLEFLSRFVAPTG